MNAITSWDRNRPAPCPERVLTAVKVLGSRKNTRHFAPTPAACSQRPRWMAYSNTYLLRAGGRRPQRQGAQKHQRPHAPGRCPNHAWRPRVRLRLPVVFLVCRGVLRDRCSVWPRRRRGVSRRRRGPRIAARLLRCTGGATWRAGLARWSVARGRLARCAGRATVVRVPVRRPPGRAACRAWC